MQLNTMFGIKGTVWRTSRLLRRRERHLMVCLHVRVAGRWLATSSRAHDTTSQDGPDGRVNSSDGNSSTTAQMAIKKFKKIKKYSLNNSRN